MAPGRLAQCRSWAGLFHGRYGTLLLTRLTLVAVIAALGARNWKRVRRVLGQPGATRALRRGAGVEVATVVVALLVTAVLVTTALPELRELAVAPRVAKRTRREVATGGHLDLRLPRFSSPQHSYRLPRASAACD